MQVPTIDVATVIPVQTGAGVTARVVAGDLARVPIGELLEATVTSANPRELALTVNGLPLTVRPPIGVPPFQPGAVLLLRVPQTATSANTQTVELSLPAPANPQSPATGAAQGAAQRVPGGAARAASETTAGTTPSATQVAAPAAQTAPPLPPPRLAVVDVLVPLPSGQVRAQIDGVERVATPSEPLAPGGRYVLRVEQSPTGIKLSPPPEGSVQPAEVAAAVLRSPAPALPESLKSLQAELAALATPTAGTARPAPAAVREAANAVENTLRTILPNDQRAPDAAQLRQLVEDGGLHFEAKLARLITDPDQSARAPNTTAPASDRAAPTARDLGPDLKGDLLRLLQAVNDLGPSAHAPAAEATVRGIESQQAANALAQANGTPYFLQVPFPDAGAWRTLHLSLEPQYRSDQTEAERAGRFRVFMHVPLTDLGETWIDAGVAGDQFRATIYLDRAAVRDRVRSALPELRAELQAEGFSEVLLDVRSSSELPERHRREASAMQAGRPETVSVLDVRA